MADLRGNKDNIQEAILEVELVQRLSVYTYQGDQPLPFLKITVALPRLIAACKRLLEKENIYPTFPDHRYKAYESNIDFDIRQDIQWIFLNYVKYKKYVELSSVVEC